MPFYVEQRLVTPPIRAQAYSRGPRSSLWDVRLSPVRRLPEPETPRQAVCRSSVTRCAGLGPTTRDMTYGARQTR